MRILRDLAETPIGRALIAYFFDLPRWTLMNLLLALACAPVVLAWLEGERVWIGLYSLPAALVCAGMVNMAARQTGEDAPRWRDTLRYRDTYLAAGLLWAAGTGVLALLLTDPPAVAFFTLCALALALFMIGIFGLFLPPLLKVQGWLVWRNALVLAVLYPIVALGLLALLAVAAWAVWVSRGGLILVMPAMWTMIAVFSVHDRIQATPSTAHSG